MQVTPDSAGVCGVTNGIVSYEHVGTCTITASSTDGDYDSTDASQQITIARGDELLSIASAPPANPQAGAEYTPKLSLGHSTGARSLALAPGNTACSINGTTVRFERAGTCAFRAVRAESADYTAAESAAQSFAVGAGLPATITSHASSTHPVSCFG